MTTYGSLFSGVGGFDMGFDNAGYDCRWQVEWDKHCQQTLTYHWPDIPRHGDVQDVSGYDLEPVDVIIYGSPCQDLSVAGRRAGLDGGKSSMFFESVRIFKEMRDATGGVFPRIVVWENVPGALNSNKGRDFGAVLTALDDIGALGQWWNVLDAQYFGVPQRRRRVFLISVFDPAIIGRTGTRQILSVGKGRRRNPAKGKTAGQDIAGTLGGRSGNRGWLPDTDRMTFIAFHPHYHDGARPQGDVINTVTSRWGTGGNNATMIAANTVVRRLTPIECERLMGWPDDHTLHRADGKTNSDSTRYKMCGNGVATPVAQWIAQQLKGIL